MSYCSRVYRHRNPHSHDESAKEPFFSKQNDINKTGQRSAFFQAKLSVNEPGDKYEQEADSVANAVVSNHASGNPLQQKNISNIQRLATPLEDEKLSTNDARMERDKEIQEKSIQKMDDPMKEEKDKMKTSPVQAKQDGTSTTASSGVSSKIENSSGKGNPLPQRTLQEMNSSFGVDFSGVKIHNNAEAINMNKELQAQAFTHGSDIYFNEGKYNPENSEGKFLLAHELTHVVQQSAAKNDKNVVRRKPVSEAEESAFAFSHPGEITRVGTLRTDAIPDNEFMLWNYLVGSAELRQSHKNLLLSDVIPRWKKQLALRPELMVNILGSASSTGQQKSNDALALKRSEVLKNFLANNGVPDDRVINSGVGTTQPLAPEDTAENMSRNRRVEMSLFVPFKTVSTLGNKVTFSVNRFQSTFDSSLMNNEADPSKNFAFIRSNGIRTNASVTLSGDPNAQMGMIQFLTADNRVAKYKGANSNDFVLDYNSCTGAFLPCRDVNEAMNTFSFDGPGRVANANGQLTNIKFSDVPGTVFPLKEGSGNLENFSWRMDFTLVLGIKLGKDFMPLKFQTWFLEYAGEPDVKSKTVNILSKNVAPVGNGDNAPPGLNMDAAMQLRTCRFLLRRLETPASKEKGCRPQKK